MKIFRAYAVTAIICLSLTSIFACIFIADESAKKITLGDESAVVVLSSADEKLYEQAVNPMPIIEKIKQAAERAASIAPPPVSNIYWFAVNSENLLN